MATTYRNFMMSISPPWLRTPEGEAWTQGVGDIKDVMLERLKEGVKARFPTEAANDALDRIGEERLLPRAYFGETQSAYAERLVDAWTVWPFAGTAYGVLTALWDYGYSNYPYIAIAKGKLYHLDSNKQLVVTTGSFSFDVPTHWATFRVLFPSPLPPSWISGGVPAHGSAEALRVISVINRWKDAKALLEKVIIQNTGLMWGFPLSQLWGGGGLTWGGTVTIWTP